MPTVVTRTVRQAPDGTRQQELNTARDSVFLEPHWPPVDAMKAIDVGLAMQLGVFEILAALEPYSVDVTALVKSEGTDIQSRRMEFNEIHFDWATQESDLQDNMPSAAIRLLSPTKYDAANLSMALIEETCDLFAPNTVLKKVSHATATIEVVAWFAHKDDRGGARKALEDSLLDDPNDERSGRRVLVKAYFDRTVRLMLDEINYPDTGPEAQANQWILRATLLADCDVVKLVQRPGLMPVPPTVSVDTTITDDADLA